MFYLLKDISLLFIWGTKNLISPNFWIKSEILDQIKIINDVKFLDLHKKSGLMKFFVLQINRKFQSSMHMKFWNGGKANIKLYKLFLSTKTCSILFFTSYSFDKSCFKYTKEFFISRNLIN